MKIVKFFIKNVIVSSI